MSTIYRALFSGTIASILTAVGLAALSSAEGKHPLGPINATSHWLIGDKNIKLDGFDTKQTLIGIATHHAAAIFWALVHEFGAGRFSPQRYREITAAPTAVFAAILGYGLLPRRLSPGWELAVSKRSVSAGFLLLGLGLALGSMMGNGVRKSSLAIV